MASSGNVKLKGGQRQATTYKGESAFQCCLAHFIFVGFFFLILVSLGIYCSKTAQLSHQHTIRHITQVVFDKGIGKSAETVWVFLVICQHVKGWQNKSSIGRLRYFYRWRSRRTLQNIMSVLWSKYSLFAVLKCIPGTNKFLYDWADRPGNILHVCGIRPPS